MKPGYTTTIWSSANAALGPDIRVRLENFHGEAWIERWPAAMIGQLPADERMGVIVKSARVLWGDELEWR